MFKTVSYYVQQLYATNAGTNVLSLTMQKKPVANQDGQNGLFASAAFDAKTGEIIVKVANTSKQAQPIQLNFSDVKGDRTATTWTLCHQGMDDENSICKPELITPQKGTAQVTGDKKQAVLKDELAPMSFRIYRFKK
jgi:alpha-L-arabinofuranosidase